MASKLRKYYDSDHMYAYNPITSEWIAIEGDPSGSLIMITHEHAKVHAGEFFGTGYYNSSVADGSDIDFLIQAGASHDVHLNIRIISGGDALFAVYEGPTITAAGTAATPVNHNRNYSTSPNLTATHTPTLSADGSLIWQEFLPGGTKNQSPGAIQNAAAEQVVLKAGEDYLFRLTNNAGSTQGLQLQFSFYEVNVG